jgi:hypothetical protein
VFIQIHRNWSIAFLPFYVVFGDCAPAVSAYGQALVSVVDVNFDIRVFAFSVPRVFAVFNQFASWAFHVVSKSIGAG